MISCIAFLGSRRLARGELRHVALQAKKAMDRDQWAQVLIFDDVTSQVIELDLRGTPQDVVSRLAEPAPPAEEEPRRPGRPKLGVVAREVTLLPRHWDWLASQPGGASVALRKLVELAARQNQGKDRRRRAQESAYRFLSAMAGNLPGFEEATRALFTGDAKRFAEMVKAWPVDVREHAKKLAALACN